MMMVQTFTWSRENFNTSLYTWLTLNVSKNIIKSLEANLNDPRSVLKNYLIGQKDIIYKKFWITLFHIKNIFSK